MNSIVMTVQLCPSLLLALLALEGLLSRHLLFCRLRLLPLRRCHEQRREGPQLLLGRARLGGGGGGGGVITSASRPVLVL